VSSADGEHDQLPLNDTLTVVAGVRVGHWSDPVARTGCTVVLFDGDGALASGQALGAAPGTREVALLAPEKTVQRVHGFVLTGGSAFGLAAADGVVTELERRGVGLATPAGRVPIVPSAALYDLSVGAADVRPDAAAGVHAVTTASDEPVLQGAVGVGCGATVGKLAGLDQAVSSGLGSASASVAGATVAALAVSNAMGDLVDPDDGSLIAGSGVWRQPERAVRLFETPVGGHTTLVVVVTDAQLDKAGAYALAHAAHIGIARVTRPSHTSADGDTTFVATTGRGPSVALAALGACVQEVVARAIVRGARAVAA